LEVVLVPHKLKRDPLIRSPRRRCSPAQTRRSNEKEVAAQCSVISDIGSHFETGFEATTTPVAPAVPRVFAFSMQAEQSIVVDPKSPGGINSPHGLILFDGVCVLCSRGCRFVSKRDRRGYFRFVPIQLAEGRPLAEQLGIDPDHPDSFAFLASGQVYVKSEAVLRIARELPRWQWTWIFQFIPRVIRDAIYDLVARNRYRWFGRRDACILPNSDRSWPS
jgi:predicted DCC family thiol-disulfide oxidoreductase YuxK